MRSKAPLVLMEQLIMALVFAIAAALCLQVFAVSDKLSGQYAVTDRAVLEAQTAVERLKHDKDTYLTESGATRDGDAWVIALDENWNHGAEDPAYSVRIVLREPTVPYLQQADVSVCTVGGETLFSLSAAWQSDREEAAYE